MSSSPLSSPRRCLSGVLHFTSAHAGQVTDALADVAWLILGWWQTPSSPCPPAFVWMPRAWGDREVQGFLICISQ